MGYQRLRENIAASPPLRWRVQFDDDMRDAYVVFKALSVEFAALLTRRVRRNRRRIPSLPRGYPSIEEAQRTLVASTSWRVTKPGFEDSVWWFDPGNGNVQGDVGRVLEKVQKQWHGRAD
jgi:hypothetical protein